MWIQSLGPEDPLEEGMATVFLPEESFGQRSLAYYSPQRLKESDMTKHACKAALYWTDTGDIPEKNLHFFLYFFLNLIYFGSIGSLQWEALAALWHVGS